MDFLTDFDRFFMSPSKELRLVGEYQYTKQKYLTLIKTETLHNNLFYIAKKQALEQYLSNLEKLAKVGKIELDRVSVYVLKIKTRDKKEIYYFYSEEMVKTILSKYQSKIEDPDDENPYNPIPEHIPDEETKVFAFASGAEILVKKDTYMFPKLS